MPKFYFLHPKPVHDVVTFLNFVTLVAAFVVWPLFVFVAAGCAAETSPSGKWHVLGCYGLVGVLPFTVALVAAAASRYALTKNKDALALSVAGFPLGTAFIVWLYRQLDFS